MERRSQIAFALFRSDDPLPGALVDGGFFCSAVSRVCSARSIAGFLPESSLASARKNSPSVDILIKLAMALEPEVPDFFIFPEKGARDWAIELLETVSLDDMRKVLQQLSRR